MSSDSPRSSARRYGVVGWPLTYTLSPAMHRAAMDRFGLAAEYQAFPVDPSGWDSFLTWAVGNLQGFNVTVPFKERAAGECPDADADVRACGSANTWVHRSGKWSAHSTDGDGLVDDLRAQGWPLSNASVVVWGAGGAGRAAVHAILKSQLARKITVYNRTAARAVDMVRRLAQGSSRTTLAVADDVVDALSGADLVINATSVGLAEGDPSPIPPDLLHPRLAVYDMVYHRETALMAAAHRAGSPAADGLGMLVAQGARSFELWFEDDLKKIDYNPQILRETMGRAARVALKRN